MPLQFFDPGMLRAPLTLQAYQDVSDGQGGVMRSWITITDLYAHMEPVSGSAQSRGRADEALANYRITIRYRDDIEADYRFLRNEREIYIREIHDLDETKRYLVCRCQEIKP